ncbi:MAG TPA: DNA-binding response regulator [Verrucomicrobiales bacterium]|nr:DNA-binding response regulator [Verrucomicrobiales bacterium]
MSLSAIIVDDEPPARDRVRSLLAEEEDIRVVEECRDGVEAIAAIERHRPDIAFLDIQMPEVNGFQVLRSVPRDLWPAVVFCTAFDQHAVQAFELHAIDYLLKPFKPARFREAVARARATRAASRPGDPVQERLLALLESRNEAQHITRIVVKEEGRTQFLRTSEIDWIEAAGNYLVVHLGKTSHVIRDTLSGLESRLSPREFLRVSRSALVNTGRVKELQPLAAGENVLILRDGTRIPTTRPARELEEALRFS